MRRALRPIAFAGILGVGLASAASAALTRADLAGVALAPRPGARIPAGLGLRDLRTGRATTVEALSGGKATILLPVDYACRNVCDPTLAAIGAALAASGLTAGEAYRLVLVGLRPDQAPEPALAMAQGAIGEPEIGRRASVSAAAADALPRLMGAIGYGYRYDTDIDQFAHPAGAILLAADGTVARALAPLSLTPRDLRLALVEAGENRYASLADRITLLCYGADPATGIYTPVIRRVLMLGGIATVLAMAAGLALLVRRERSTPV